MRHENGRLSTYLFVSKTFADPFVHCFQVFTPLLASTSVGTLEFRTALEPVRSRRSKFNFFQGWADAVDFKNQTLTIEEAVEDPRQSRSLISGEGAPDGDPSQAIQDQGMKVAKGRLFAMDYDKLVVAVGCYNQTFNTKGVKENAYFLKDVGDARRIRNRILSCFETAALPTISVEVKKLLLNFAVVGGGPTGIEWSAELHDLIHEDMRKIYPDLVQYSQITVYDVAPKVLSMFDERLSQYAMDHFKREGIEIKTQHHVVELRKGVPSTLAGRKDILDSSTCYTINIKELGEIGIGMCVWSTGLTANPFIQNSLNGKLKHQPKSQNIFVNSRLQVRRSNDSIIPNVFALGDCATMEDSPYPATAQVASQEAGWLAKRLNRGDIDSQEFTYRDLGIMAYVGNWNAIVQSQGHGVSGRAAWLVWRGAYLTKSVSWRNKVLIPVYWFINWLFGRDVSRF